MQDCSSYWRRTLVHTAALMAVWVLVSFVWVYWAREIDALWPGSATSYYLASQAALLIFLIIVWVHALWMDRLDHRARLSPQRPPP